MRTRTLNAARVQRPPQQQMSTGTRPVTPPVNAEYGNDHVNEYSRLVNKVSNYQNNKDWNWDWNEPEQHRRPRKGKGRG
eukprot:8740860-Heterocapsa_arctica.AAC.1